MCAKGGEWTKAAWTEAWHSKAHSGTDKSPINIAHQRYSAQHGTSIYFPQFDFRNNLQSIQRAPIHHRLLKLNVSPVKSAFTTQIVSHKFRGAILYSAIALALIASTTDRTDYEPRIAAQRKSINNRGGCDERTPNAHSVQFGGQTD